MADQTTPSTTEERSATVEAAALPETTSSAASKTQASSQAILDDVEKAGKQTLEKAVKEPNVSKKKKIKLRISNSTTTGPKPSVPAQRPPPQASDSVSYANRHIPVFLDLFTTTSGQDLIQVVTDGRQLSTQAFGFGTAQSSSSLSMEHPVLVTDTPQSIGMKLPSCCGRSKSFLSLLRRLADLLGWTMPVSVINVSQQEEIDNQWTLSDLVEYFELDGTEGESAKDNTSPTACGETSTQEEGARRPARSAALRARKVVSTATQPRRGKVLNQISLEFSSTELAKHVKSPKVVRELDWIDTAWPSHWRNERHTWPAVQYYCLTSASGSYTDFHVDFGGTSVWYHVLAGRKCFCLIEPTAENLAVYEKWLCDPQQAVTFLPDLIDEQKNKTLTMVTLEAGQTMMIPSGWIHAVYTPEDSVVFGGNFLHGGAMRQQIAIYDIESRTHVRERFRVPFFRQILFYAGGMYLRRLRHGRLCQREVEELPALIDALTRWWEEARAIEEDHDQKYASKKQAATPKLETLPTVFTAAVEVGRDSQTGGSVEGFLDALRQEVDRVIQRGICPNPEPIRPVDVARSSKDEPVHDDSKELKTNSTGLAPKTNDTTTSPSPRLKLKVSLAVNREQSGCSMDADDDKSNDNPFRIFISNQPPSVLGRRGKRWSSDAVGRGNQDDDEWTPTEGPSVRSSASHTGTAPRPKKRASATSKSRQRLLKRCR